MSTSCSHPVARVPEIIWYQNQERVYVTLSMSDVSPDQEFAYNLRLSGDQLELISPLYHFRVQLYQPVSLITHGYNGRIIEVILEKTLDEGETTAPFWEKLTRDGVFNKRHVKVDWNRWIDEDDNEYTDIPDMSEMPWGDYGEEFQNYLQHHQTESDTESDTGAEESVEPPEVTSPEVTSPEVTTPKQPVTTKDATDSVCCVAGQ